MVFHLVEKKNHLAVHGHFETKERAERRLRDDIPNYVARGYFMNKTLKSDDFEIVDASAPIATRDQRGEP